MSDNNHQATSNKGKPFFLYVSLGIVLLLQAALGVAQTDAGTELWYRNLEKEITWKTVVQPSLSPMILRYLREDGSIVERYLFCKYCASKKNQIDTASYEMLFPLVIGNQVSLSRWKIANHNQSWTHQIRVEREEMLHTRFSEEPVRTLVIQEEISSDQKNWQGSVTYWYAPGLQANVMIIDNAADKRDKISATELIQYKPADK